MDKNENSEICGGGGGTSLAEVDNSTTEVASRRLVLVGSCNDEDTKSTCGMEIHEDEDSNPKDEELAQKLQASVEQATEQVRIFSNLMVEFSKSIMQVNMRLAELDNHLSRTNISKDENQKESDSVGFPMKTFKEEQTLMRMDGHNNGESKLGLLVLADAALQSRAEDLSHIDSSHKCAEAFSDSGRSTAGGSYTGSPCQGHGRVDFFGQKSKSLGFFTSTPTTALKTTVKRAASDNRDLKRDSILPSSPDYGSSSDSSPEAKSRKRRKLKQALPCGYCGKFFNNQSSLRQHESFHRPARPFKCEHEKCEKAYKTRSELNRHLVVHSGEKKHFCKLCNKRFLRKQYLKTHLLRHHESGITMITPTSVVKESNGENGIVKIASDDLGLTPSSFVSQAEPLTWRCHLCFKIFVNNEDLNKHLKSYHEKKRSSWTVDQKT